MWGELRPTMRAAARDAPARRRVPAGATRSAAHRTARAAAKPQHAEQRDILGRAHTWQWRPRPFIVLPHTLAPGPAWPSERPRALFRLRLRHGATFDVDRVA